MRINVSAVFILVSCMFLGSLQAIAGERNSQDQAANLVRTLKSRPVPTEVKFIKPDQTPAASLKHIEGQEENKFTLKALHLTGNTIYTTQELSRIWQPYMLREVSLGDIQKIAQRITQHYRQQGYVLAQVLLPTQEINPVEGGVKIQILEGTLGEVKVEGGGDFERQLVKSQLKEIPVGRPFNTNELERHLLNIRKIPGMNIQSVLVPSADKQGNTSLIFKIGNRRYADANFGFSNMGNKYTGQHQLSADAMVYNLAGRSKLALSHRRSMQDKLFNFYRVRQTQLLGNNGTRAYVEFINSLSRPLIPLVNKGNYKYANFMIMHPLIFKRDKSLRVRAALDGQNDSSVYQGLILKNDHIRTARLGLLYNASQEFDFWEVSATVNKGFSKALGARKTMYPSRFGGKNDVIYEEGKALWFHKFNSYFSLSNSIGWQYSHDPLLATEEFAVGGSNFVRGYDSTETTADCGYGGLTELRLTTQPSLKGVDYIQYYTSLGGAQVKNHKQKVDNLSRESLASFAVGVRSSLFKHFDFSLQAGKPLTRRAGIRANKKWDYTGMISLRMSLSKEWDKSVPELDGLGDSSDD